MFYKKTKKYKSKKYKYKKTKKYGGPTTNYKAIKVIMSNTPNKCYKSCNSSNSSKEFQNIYTKYSDLLKKGKLNMFQMKQERFIDLFSELALNKSSYTFYKTKQQSYNNVFKKKHKRHLELPKKEDISYLIDYICNLTSKEMCVLIGFAEMLAIFGINFHEQLAKPNIDTINRVHINNLVRKKLKYVVSSMDGSKWNARLNQKIIIDALNDAPSIDKEPWHLINTALCLIMPVKIHDENKLQNKLQINWEKALEESQCRVTREELCLISLHKNLKADYIECTKDYHIYVFTKQQL